MALASFPTEGSSPSIRELMTAAAAQSARCPISSSKCAKVPGTAGLISWAATRSPIRLICLRGGRPRPLCSQNHDQLPTPEEPLLSFPPHVAAVKFDVAPKAGPWAGQIFVALFGDERPMTAPPGPGRVPLRGVASRARPRPRRGQVIKGAVKCNGAVLCFNPDGSDLELIAWGFRNPYGIAFHPDGRPFLTEHNIDERGARHIIGDSEDLYVVEKGEWYGWLDFATGIRLDDPRWRGRV